MRLGDARVWMVAGLAAVFAGCLGTVGDDDGGSSASGSSSSSSSASSSNSSTSQASSSSGTATSGSCPNCGSGLICCTSGELANQCVTQFECEDSGTTSSSSSSGSPTSVQGSSGSGTAISSSGSGGTTTIISSGGSGGTTTIISSGGSGGTTTIISSSGSGGTTTIIGSSGSGTTVMGSSGSGTIVMSSSSSSGGSLLGTPCTVTQSGPDDACFAQGLACIGVSVVSATGTCQLPTNGYPCLASPGCATGESCVGQTGQMYCYQDCTTTSDCSETYETCQAAGGGVSLCVAETCSNFYGLCNVIGTDDGYCVPFSDPPNPDYGLCIAGAPVDAGVPSSCTTFGRGGGLCPVGMFCYTDYETTGTQCQPFCASVPINGAPGPSCSGGDFCVENYGNLFGSCAPTCPVPDVASNCPPQENCLVTGQALPDGGQAFTCEP